MAASAPNEQVPGPSGCKNQATADRFVDLKVSMKVASSIGKKWKWLGRVMGFEDDQITNIEMDNTHDGIEETVYSMVKAWQRNLPEQATVKVLAEHLKEVERGDLAREILKMAAESSSITSHSRSMAMPRRCSSDGRGLQRRYSQSLPISQEELDRTWTTIKSALQMEHKRRQIPKIPWLKDWEMDFKKYYVDLTINHITDTEIPLHLQDIFKPKESEVNSPRRILIEGPAGYGKSTLTWKLCDDHAKGEHYIRHFDAVILLCVRSLEGTLEEMITEALQLVDCTAEQVVETIKQKQSKILIILDGFGELHQDKYKHITPLLKGRQLTHATVIVTSRLGSIELPNDNEESPLNLLQCVDSRILIKGITADNRIRFLQLFLNSYTYEKVVKLISLIENTDGFFWENHKHLFNCPLFLLLFVIAHEEIGIDSIKSKTDLYKFLFNFTLRRTFLKEVQTDQRVDFFDFNDSHPPDYVQMLYQFGLLSGKALKERKFYFSTEDIFCGCGESLEILKLGILTQNESKNGHKRKTWYEPLHLTFLEFAFAYSMWIALLHTPNCLALFNLRWTMCDNNFNFLSRVLPFLFGLCGKQLTKACSALRVNRSEWLRIFTTSFDIERELIAESKLQVSELAKAFLSLIPSDHLVLQRHYLLHDYSILNETLMQALQTNQINRIIIADYYKCSSECNYKLPRKIMVTPDTNSYLSTKGLKDVATHQNAKLVAGRTQACNFILTICDAHITKQLRWISNLLIFVGSIFNKSINEITFSCPESAIEETLHQISQLISKGKVVSVTLLAGNRCSDHVFKKFVQRANRSTQLLDMKIIAGSDNPVIVDLGGKEGKIWRKIELIGKVIPRVGKLLGSPNEFNRLNVKRFIRELPSRIHTFHLSSTVPSCMPSRLIVHNNDSPMTQSQCEMHIKLENNAKSLLELCNIAYLNTLKVLEIGLPTEAKLNKQDIITSILFFISHALSLVRIELWSGWTEEFIKALFEGLIKENIQSKNNRYQSGNKNFLLDTLMLSPLVSSKSETPGSSIAYLAKELLQSGVLRHLWLSSVTHIDGYAKMGFIKLFPPTEGFFYEMEEKSSLQEQGIAENTLSWCEPYINKNCCKAMCVFKVSWKRKSI